MTGPRPVRRMTREQYEASRANGWTDEDLQAQGFEVPETYSRPGSLGRTATGLLGKFAQGVSFGTADEIGGVLLSPFARGKTWGDKRAEATNIVRGILKDTERDAPVTSTLTEIGGGVLSPVLAAHGGSVGKTLAQRVLRNAKIGAVTGGVAGAANAEGDLTDRFEAGVKAAPVGAVLAPALGEIVGRVVASSPVTSTARKAQQLAAKLRGRVADEMRGHVPSKWVERVRGVAPVVDDIGAGERKALEYAGKVFARDKKDLAQALETPGEAGDLVFNRGGRATGTATRVAQMIPSRATDEVPRRIYGQLEEEPQRIVAALEKATGRKLGNADTRLRELSEDAARVAKPAYAPMEGLVLQGDDVAALMERPAIRDAVAEGQRNLRNKGWKPASTRLPNEPSAAAAGAGVAPVAARSPVVPKAGQSERGLWLTARSQSGTRRKLETVETAGLLDDLLRRQELDKYYNTNVRKYGPNSAVTRRNYEDIFKIQDILAKRDGIPFEQLDEILATRRATLAEQMGQETLSRSDLERIVHASANDTPRASPVANAVEVAKEAATPQKATAAYHFEEMDNAKKVLDARIEDLDDKIAKGIDKGMNEHARQGLLDARQALVDYLDEATAGQYAKARETAAPAIRVRESFRSGTNYGPSTSRDALQLEQAARSPQERASFLEGAAHRIRDDVERTGDRRNVAARFVGSTLERDKLAAAGDNAVVKGAFDNAMRRADQARAALVPGQSMTAPLGEAAADFKGGDLLAMALQYRSLPRMAADKLVTTIAKMRGVDEEAAGILGDIMTAAPGSPRALALAAQFKKLTAQRQAALVAGRSAGARQAGMLVGRSER